MKKVFKKESKVSVRSPGLAGEPREPFSVRDLHSALGAAMDAGIPGETFLKEMHDTHGYLNAFTVEWEENIGEWGEGK